jgi:uncharacterized coiled-coil protein SlyX
MNCDQLNTAVSELKLEIKAQTMILNYLTNKINERFEKIEKQIEEYRKVTVISKCKS